MSVHLAHQTPLSVLESHLLEIINEANETINHGNQVRPNNTYVTKMQKNARSIISKASQALASLGQVREEYILRD